MLDEEIKAILERFSIIDEIYDSIRVVEPTRKEASKMNSKKPSNNNCYDFWYNNEVCENCISIRAFQSKKAFYKLEHTKGNIYMTTAIPAELDGMEIVIELLKDVTESMMVETDKKRKLEEMRKMIDNINQLIVKDSLTNIYNKRYIYERLPFDMVQSSLNTQSLSLIMTDIDDFKKINDTYGHLAGDEILKQFSNIISRTIKREIDWVARFGGEEFVVCLPGASLNKAVEIAERIRLAILAHRFTYQDKIIKLSSSLGVVKMEAGMSVDDLLEAADICLLNAKSKGRNRVETLSN